MSDHKDEKDHGHKPGLREAKLAGFKPIPANESKWAKHMREAGEEQIMKAHQQKIEKQQKYSSEKYELQMALEQEAEKPKKPKEEIEEKVDRYHGYNQRLVDQFTEMGYSVKQIVAAFEWVGIDKAYGEWYELEEEYLGDVTSRLFNEA